MKNYMLMNVKFMCHFSPFNGKPPPLPILTPPPKKMTKYELKINIF